MSVEAMMEASPQRKTFIVMYLGNAILDRRYPPQFVMPWVMAEVKRRKEAFKEIRLDVQTHVLRAAGCLDNTVIFEHTLPSLSKFAKTHQDACCFAYLTRHDLYCDYECHVFLAHNEAMVSIYVYVVVSLAIGGSDATLGVTLMHHYFTLGLKKRLCFRFCLRN